MSCIEGRKGAKVDAAKYAAVFQSSEPWPDVKNWKKYDWRIVRNVPVLDLEPATREDYELDTDVSEEEADQNVERMDEVVRLLREGATLWPVIMGFDCLILDGYHRLAAAAELGIETIDVIYPVERARKS